MEFKMDHLDEAFVADLSQMNIAPSCPTQVVSQQEVQDDDKTRFDKSWQLGLLTALLSDQKFFTSVEYNLNKNVFGTPGLRLAYEVAVTLYRESPEKKLPSWNVYQLEMMAAIDNVDDKYSTSITPDQVEYMMTVMEAVKVALSHPSTTDTEYYRKDLKDFVRNAMYRNVNVAAMTPDERISYAHKVEDESNKMDASRSKILSIKDLMGIRREARNDVCRIGTGIRRIDELTNGGLRPGETGLIIAGSGVGKTTAMLNFAVNNAKLGHDALFLTLENGTDMIQNRVTSIVSSVPASQVSLYEAFMETEPYAVEAIERSYKSIVWDHLRIGNLTDRKYTCDGIGAMIEEWQNELKEEKINSGCQVVYVDWLEEIDQSGLHIERSANSDIIWQRVMSELCQIARNRNVVLWTAQQVNRQAKTKDILTQADVAHSSSVFNPIDLGIGLAEVHKNDHRAGMRNIESLGMMSSDTSKKPDTDRMMRISFTKGRESSVVGKTVLLYQGSSLKLWDDKSTCIKVMRDIKNGKLDSIEV